MWEVDRTPVARSPIQAVKYVIAYAGCYGINVAALKFFNGYLGYSHLVVQAIAVVVFALLLFLTQKFWVFRTRGISAPPAETV